MKKIIKPKQHEQAVYFSDFTGQPFDQFGPPVTLKLEFNYGSEYDQSHITLHLSDKDVAPILDLIQSKLNPDFKKSLEEDLDKNIDNMHDALDARDPLMCEYYISCNNLFKRLLGPKD
jgi:hypothetical protein